MGRNGMGEGEGSSASSGSKGEAKGAGKSKGRGNNSNSPIADAPTSRAAEVSDRFEALRPHVDSGSSRGGGGNRRSNDRQPEPWYQTQRKDTDLSNVSEDGEADEGSAARAEDVIFAEIRALVDTNSCLVLADFDYRVRQHLHAFYGNGGREKVRECLASIHATTSQKTRQSVKNWPAYLGALMKKIDADSATGDREARARARIAAARAAANPGSGTAGSEAAGEASAKSAASVDAAEMKASQRTPQMQSEQQDRRPSTSASIASEEMNAVAEASIPSQSVPPQTKLVAEPAQHAQHAQHPHIAPPSPYEEGHAPPALPHTKLAQEAPQPQHLPQHLPYEAIPQQAPQPQQWEVPPAQMHHPAHAPGAPYAPGQPPVKPPTQPPPQPPSLPPMEPPQLPPHYLPPQQSHQTGPALDIFSAPVKRPLVLDFPLEAWAAWLRTPPSTALEAR